MADFERAAWSNDRASGVETWRTRDSEGKAPKGFESPERPSARLARAVHHLLAPITSTILPHGPTPPRLPDTEPLRHRLYPTYVHPSDHTPCRGALQSSRKSSTMTQISRSRTSPSQTPALEVPSSRSSTFPKTKTTSQRSASPRRALRPPRCHNSGQEREQIRPRR